MTLKPHIPIESYESQYMRILTNIYKFGYEDGANERTGFKTKRLPSQIIKVDLKREFPILKTKFVAGITALKEILWIWQKRSNNIKDLDAKIWNKWADENGSIGKAYGYQAGMPVATNIDGLKRKEFRFYESQMLYIIEYLREMPNGRQAVATLWDPGELNNMNLVPCCHTVTFNIMDGRLNCTLDQRSGDMPYGVPFNTTQYAELTHLIAKELGVEVGILTHVISDAHIYFNQMEGVRKQIENYRLLLNLNNESECKLSRKELNKILISKPRFEVNDFINFWEVKPENCKIVNYHYMEKIDFGDVIV